MTAGDRYVNLGDSYSAAAGLQPLVENGPLYCSRSSRNFAHLVAQRRGLDLTDVSCSGAETGDFTSAQYFGIAPQLDALDPARPPRLVTVMVGGNDNETFTGTIRRCGDAVHSDPTAAPCRMRYGDSLIEPVRTQTYPAVREVFRQVREKAPGATVLAVGYPWILPPAQGCYPRVQVAAGDVGYVRELQAALNDAVRRAASETGVRFVDMAAVSEGHDACRPPDERWIEPQQGPVTAATLHPNARGEQAMADEILKVLSP
ncbi:SGNH/GDSL hydrolase family protein [Gordonia sinesedis]